MSLPKLSGSLFPAAACFAVAYCSWLWYSFVADQVGDPYLDEVFHVRQAQVYCSGDFETWDPKITTPPGLYLISYLWYRVVGSCGISTLRITNVWLISVLAAQCFYILKSGEGRQARSMRRSNLQLAHTAVNTCLFPPLFFFSALYYTDVASLVFVLGQYQAFLWYENSGFNDLRLGFVQVILGTAGLLFRQTNIFWVAIFPAGLVLLGPVSQVEQKGAKANTSTIDILQRSWKLGQVYDPWVQDAFFEDYFKTVLSLVAVAFLNLYKVIRYLLPYGILLTEFAAFVAWNGGVVLGDKSNHVATLHLPQMLYIWPYMVFFSFPIAAMVFITGFANGNSRPTTRPFALLPRHAVLVMLTTLAAVVIHYNTIVHPFTLADNRHYIFYVFRILLQYWPVKYAVTPFYAIFGWVVIRSFGGSGSADGRRAGFVLVWLATTALCLITAPLVEPRYFIVPWTIWRLSVPAQKFSEASRKRLNSPVLEKLLDPETWLWLETLWYCAVNFLTGYIFLKWTYEWPQEPGAKQRFMW